MSWDAVNPPDPQGPDMVCPNCGAWLYAGDNIYVYYKRGYRHVLGCENCISDFVEVIGEWD